MELDTEFCSNMDSPEQNARFRLSLFIQWQQQKVEIVAVST